MRLVRGKGDGRVTRPKIGFPVEVEEPLENKTSMSGNMVWWTDKDKDRGLARTLRAEDSVELWRNMVVSGYRVGLWKVEVEELITRYEGDGCGNEVSSGTQILTGSANGL